MFIRSYECGLNKKIKEIKFMGILKLWGQSHGKCVPDRQRQCQIVKGGQRWASPFSPFVSVPAIGQTTNFHLQEEEMVNGLKKIAWASVFRLIFRNLQNSPIKHRYLDACFLVINRGVPSGVPHHIMGQVRAYAWLTHVLLEFCRLAHL